VAGDRVAASLLDRLERALEAGVGVRLHLAALLADEVVVVVRPTRRFVADDPVADVDALHERLLGQRVEHPVDAGQGNAPPFAGQVVVDLLRTAAAVLRRELLEHQLPGRAGPVAGTP
jgi:hypothetical protein